MGTKHIIGWEKGIACDATITVGAVTTTVAVVVQLLDYAGNDLTVKGAIGIYLTTDANGLTQTNIDNIAAGTDGIVVELLVDKYYMAISEADGDIDLTCTEAADVDVYLNIVLPNGRIVTSTLLDFTS